MGLMGGPGVWAVFGWLLRCVVPLLLFAAEESCGRVHGAAWRGSGGREKAASPHKRRASFPTRLPPRTPGTIETSERALSAAPTASARAPRSALA